MTQEAAKMSSDGEQRRVLSVQSSVVWGYVGNKSATFPLQLHGFDVCPINTVQFSNHTEYGHFEGQVLNDADLTVLMSGMKTNGLMQFSHVLTGYIGSRSFLEKVADVVRELRSTSPDLVYVCDPVMGDNGHLYVPDDLIEPYKSTIVPLADILVPNQFELQLLADMKVTSETEALTAMNKLHEKGVGTVVLSSSDLGSSDILVALASSKTKRGLETYRLEIPKMKATFLGTGDLFACSMLTWLHKERSLKSAFEKTVATVQAVMKRTLTYAKERTPTNEVPSMRAMELQLVQSKSDLEDPHVTIRATAMSS